LVASVHETASRQANQSLADMNRLLAQSEALVSARIDAEAQWTRQHGERLEQLAGLLRSELGALRQDEAAREATQRCSAWASCKRRWPRTWPRWAPRWRRP
jgi:Tfp pilus assembly protein PilN